MATKREPEAVDIRQEIVELYARERMLAFFEFQIDIGTPAPLSGLCRISRPKSDASTLRYLSLIFLVDLTDTTTTTTLKEVFAPLRGEGLRRAVPGLSDVVPLSEVDIGSSNYIAQLDLLIEVDASEYFVRSQLVPAIAQATGIRPTNFEWWEIEPADRPSAPAPDGPSLVARLTKWLRG